MSIPQFGSGPTSNDLLERRIAENALPAPNDQIVAQSVEDVQNIEDAPAICAGPQLRQRSTAQKMSSDV